jgi:YHS domain-containing protein
MALFDNIGGLLGDLGIGVPRNTGLISDTADIDAINNRALTSGLINAGLTYLATPKNLNAGSPLPYLGRAALAGFGASQNAVDQALNTAYRNRILAARDDNIKTINEDIDGVRYEVTYKIDPNTGARTELARSMRDAPKEAKEPTLPTSAQEFERAKSDPAYMKFLREKWDAENKALKASAQVEESAYKYGTPQQSFAVNAGGKTYYFKDQNSANAFRQKAGIK